MEVARTMPDSEEGCCCRVRFSCDGVIPLPNSCIEPECVCGARPSYTPRRRVQWRAMLAYLRAAGAAGGSWPRLAGHGEREDKGGALPLHTVDRYLSSMGDQNLPDNIQAQAGPSRLRGVEGFENLRDLLGGYTDAAITDA